MVVEVTQAFADFEPPEPEPAAMAWRDTPGGNGMAREPAMAEAPVLAEAETQEAEAEPTLRAGEPLAPTEEVTSEPAEPKGNLAKKFAARRARRRTGKKGGGSLSDRLRGIVSESPESRS
jgi:hypothetical protein